MWLGPLPPGRPVVAVVDPWSGRLALEGVEDGALRDLVVVREEGDRVQAVILPDGAWIVPRYDAEGRVTAIEGPGRSRWRFTWDDELSVLDPLGRTLRVAREPLTGGGELLTVEDASGRVARTWYGEDGRSIEALEDPRGLRTVLRRDGPTLRVEDIAGRAWTLVQDAEGRPVELGLPSGGVWRWERDERGLVTRLADPAGRLTRWDRDAEGRVEAVVQGGQPWRLQRDEAGRLVALEGPAGGRVELRRDAEGRVTTIVDPAGDEIRLGRGPGSWPTSVLERSGGRWGMDLDLLGRPSAVGDPTGRRVILERDGAGRLSTLRDNRGMLVRLRWSTSGLLSRVEDARGRALALLHDAVGRMAGLRWGDGEELSLDRDMAGEVVGLRYGGERVEIGRDVLGYPSSAGLASGEVVRWQRDGASRVSAIRAPGLELRLERDASGLIRAARAGDWRVEIGRDAQGRPVRWAGTDGEITLVRDPAGRVRSTRDRLPVKLERDARGFIVRAEVEGQEFRWMRDASGRPLKVTGPLGLSLGVDWDEAGRPTLLRGPSGAMARWERDGQVSLESWVDDGGLPLASSADPCAGAWLPDGEDAWRWQSEGSCPSPIQPWGLPGDRLALSRGEDGAVARVVGPEGSVRLDRDELGRLRALSPDDGRPGWRFDYDARGRLSRVHTPSGEPVPLLWSPDGAVWPDQSALLLATGERAERVWLGGPRGLVGAAEEAWVATLLPDDAGSPVWVQIGERPQERVSTSMNGLPDSAAAGIAGARGALQSFAGGPLFAATSVTGWSGAGEVALDPLSGLRLDGRGRWPWAETLTDSRLDPELWAPEGPWSAPLALLEALGALPPVDDGSWVPIEVREPALGWLPASLDGEAPPLGPDPASLPLEDDPLTNAILLAVLRGQPGTPPHLPLAVAMEESLDLPWLPPGISLPGLDEPFARTRDRR